eukprot:gnl/MRDRNA2_/MRDRNA2_41307_c0_seq1.p1 gnl/MRDRNA2_/MRDRNA2_41307_c0~~gnl/MRDRNA2_/MRDRNA2_41307_c0_seq1.p1  ORF type:complete len:150 (+),score=16.84 gnl/MRDRNA2_/MRDRNA2_41307_c0_seq1:38-451(+)
MALTFILDMDEMVESRLGSVCTNTIMEKIEPYHFWNAQDLKEESDSQAHHAWYENTQWKGFKTILFLAFPRRLTSVIIICIIVMAVYDYANCVQYGQGLVSKDLFAPQRVWFSPLNAMLGTIEYEDDAIWTMPDPSN